MKRLLTIVIGLSAFVAQAYGEDIARFCQPDTFGQKFIVKGRVVDSLSREPEVSAVLQFFSAVSPDKPMAYAITGTDGSFEQPIEEAGDYFLLFCNLGRMEHKVSFSLGDEDVVDLGEILVRDDPQMLQGAAVTAQRILVKMDVDKMTYDVENDDDAKTSTILDMLRKVPMVTVDGEDKISVNGSDNFQVTVDGKPNPFFSSNPSQIFKMMPASAVKDIEVITNPGVKYDAEGVGGVLNINMAVDSDGGALSADGYNCTVSFKGGNKGIGGNAFYSQKKEKFTFSLNASMTNAYLNNSRSETLREQYTADGTVSTLLRSEFDLKAPILLANLSASYEIDGQNLVSATAGFTGISSNIDGSATASIGPIGYECSMSNRSRTYGINANVDYQHGSADVEGRLFTLSYQLSAAPAGSDALNRYSGMEEIASFLPTDMLQESKSLSLDNTLQADFTTPLGEAFSLNAGAKFIGRHNSSLSDLSLWDGIGFAHDDGHSTRYDFYNNIGSAYAELSAKRGKLSAKAGVRHEQTWQRAVQDGGSFKTDYGIAVPAASLQYNIGMLSNIGLSYNMRISRPGISYLNPYVDVSDPTAKSYGNPDLDVEKAHNLSLVYNFMTPRLIMNITGRCGYNGDGISSYSFYDSEGMLNTTYGNIVKNRNAGMNCFVTIMPGSKSRIIINGGAGYDDFSSAELGQSNCGWSWNLLAGLQQTLPWDLRLSANFIFTGNSYSLQGWTTGIRMGSLGVTKSFLDERLALSINGATNLGKGGLEVRSYTTGRDFSSTSVSSLPIRQLSIGLSWTIGGGKISVKKAARTITNDHQINTSSQAESLSNSGVLEM